MRHVFFVALACGSVAAAQGKVWVVDDDGGPGVDFTEVQGAVDAAADGDVVLIEDGSYASVTVSGKGLSLVADEGAQVLVPAMKVLGLGASQSFVARGLSLGTTSPVLASGEHLLLENDAGPILFEDCSIGAQLMTLDVRGATVDACDSVVFVHSDLHGAPDYAGLVGQNRPGMVIADSSVHLFGCEVRGGDGKDGDPSDPDGGGGATGIVVTDGFLYLAGTEVQGGAGGDDFSITCGVSGGGGSGVYAGASSVVRPLDSTIQGGPGGGQGPGPCPQPGSTGAPFYAEAGADVATLPGLARTMQSESPVREGQVASSTYFGQPGDLVFGAWGIAQDHVYWEIFGGTSIPLTLAAAFLGVIPPSGSFGFGLPLGDLAPGVDSLTIFSQIMVLPQGAPLILGNPTAVVILDESF